MIQLLLERTPALFFAFVFAFGAVVGSFLNVVIARVPARRSVVSPSSSCPRCGSLIAWYDNIPIVSWLVLRGRCRRCRSPISARYPMVELLTAVLAVALVHRYGATLEAAGYFAFAAALIALAYIDLDTWLLPNEITLPALALGLASPLWNPELGFRASIIGAAAGFGLFAGIALVGEKILRRETMGWGDVWLLAVIGAWLGWTALLPVVMLSALQGSVVGIVLLKLKPPDSPTATPTPTPIIDSQITENGNPVNSITDEPPDDWVPPKHAVQYGPFLALAALEQLLLGDMLVRAYDGLLRRLWS